MRGVSMVIVVMVGCDQTPQFEVGRDHPAAPDRFLPDCNVKDGEVLTAHAPTEKDVHALLSRNYGEPKQLRVTLKVSDDRPDILEWERTYDGVRLDAEIKTAEAKGGWCTHFRRELGEPARVRHAALISSEAAIAKSGLSTTTAELVHHARYKQLQHPGTKGDNAMDYDLVLDGTDLLYIVIGAREELVYVDPYSGEIRERVPPRRGCL